MSGIIKAEFYKLSRSRLMWFSALINMVILSQFFRHGTELSDILLFFAKADFLLITLQLTALYSMAIAHDYASGYFTEAVCAGYPKYQVYLARYAVFLTGSIIIIAIPYLLLLIRKTDGTETADDAFKVLLSALGFLLLYCVCISAFFMMMTILLKSYASVVLICIFLNIIIFLVHEIIPADAAPPWIFYLFFGRVNQLLGPETKSAEAVRIILALAGQAALYTCIGCLVFHKRELR